ncbi:MAG: hypothetical protein LBR44_06710 [Clostridiales Family XIII bacterium]|nr:hypothetical protein [Clostridiales Family XIII bacterium]
MWGAWPNAFDPDADAFGFYARYVNEGNGGFLPLARAKRLMFGGLAGFAGLGMLLAVSGTMQSAGMLAFFLAVVALGSAGILLSDRWFPDNRCFFVVYGAGAAAWSWVFLMVGVGFGIQIVGDGRIGAVVILTQCMLMCVIVAGSLKRISRKAPLKRTARGRAGMAGAAACGGYVGGILLPCLLAGKAAGSVLEIIAFCACLAMSVMMWFGVERLFQLYYATKFGIEVCDAWGGSPQAGMAAEKKRFDWGPLYCGVLSIVLYTAPLAGLYAAAVGLVTAVLGRAEFDVRAGLVSCAAGLLVCLLMLLGGHWGFAFFGFDFARIQ